MATRGTKRRLWKRRTRSSTAESAQFLWRILSELRSRNGFIEGTAVWQTCQRVGLGAFLRFVERIADRVQLPRRLDKARLQFGRTCSGFGRLTINELSERTELAAEAWTLTTERRRARGVASSSGLSRCNEAPYDSEQRHDVAKGDTERDDDDNTKEADEQDMAKGGGPAKEGADE